MKRSRLKRKGTKARPVRLTKVEQKLDNWFLMNADFETLEKMGFEMFGSDDEEAIQKRVDDVNAWWKNLSLEKKADYYNRFATGENDYEIVKKMLGRKL